MASEAQIAANRRNAEKSTGPKTGAGKAAVARNALQHGMTAAAVVLFDEIEAEFEEFHEGITLDFEPRGSAECALVERIAILAWRLRRASRTEAALMNTKARERNKFLEDEEWPHEPRADIGLTFSSCSDEIIALTRYESMLERQLNRAIATLERLQEQRWARQEIEEDERNDRSLPEPGSAYTNPRPYMGRPEDGFGAK